MIEVEVQVRAIGSTDAQSKAKSLLRESGRRVGKIAALRTVDGDYNPKIAQDWIVRVEVRA